jgi:hypothetical protein
VFQGSNNLTKLVGDLNIGIAIFYGTKLLYTFSKAVLISAPSLYKYEVPVFVRRYCMKCTGTVHHQVDTTWYRYVINYLYQYTDDKIPQF